MQIQATLIVGANSEIAKALAQQVANDNETRLIVISRNINFYKQQQLSHTQAIQVENYDEASIKSAINKINDINALNLTRIFICHGLLHNKNLKPEKRLSDFSAGAFTQVMTANTITPMLWIKSLVPLIAGKKPAKIVVFNARVGSISDNETGGWYSYRTSKAAMNMLLKSAAIELARIAKNIKLISFHPGTTDSPLSKPFQKNIPETKLFSADFVAMQLIKIVDKTPVDGKASFIDWQGKSIPW